MASLKAIKSARDRLSYMIDKHTIGGSGSQPDKYEQAYDYMTACLVRAQAKHIAELEALKSATGICEICQAEAVTRADKAEAKVKELEAEVAALRVRTVTRNTENPEPVSVLFKYPNRQEPSEAIAPGINIPQQCSQCRSNIYTLQCPKCMTKVRTVLHTPEDTEGSCTMCLYKRIKELDALAAERGLLIMRLWNLLEGKLGTADRRLYRDDVNRALR